MVNFLFSYGLWMPYFQILFFTFIENQILETKLWPEGSYGLPEPTTGCPNGDSWSSGSVYQNTEDELNSNRHSSVFHSRGSFTEKGIEMGFCMKEANNDSSKPWPMGKYCIYKYKACPDKFETGEIFWHDEKSSVELPNQHSGSLPDGNYNLTGTLIKFCCRYDGNTSQPIQLPTESPFYLFPAVKECQLVFNTEVNNEWIHFDDEDEGNMDYISGSVPYGPNPQEDYNIVLRLCYYTEKEEQSLKMDQKEKKPQIKYKKSTILGISAGAGGLLVLSGIAALLKTKIMKFFNL